MNKQWLGANSTTYLIASAFINNLAFGLIVDCSDKSLTSVDINNV
jgi:hypothetical protein